MYYSLLSTLWQWLPVFCIIYAVSTSFSPASPSSWQKMDLLLVFSLTTVTSRRGGEAGGGRWSWLKLWMRWIACLCFFHVPLLAASCAWSTMMTPALLARLLVKTAWWCASGAPGQGVEAELSAQCSSCHPQSRGRCWHLCLLPRPGY